jgi:hypothetical protein
MNHANRLLRQLRNVLQEKKEFPIGTLIYFGPDDVTITKIIAVVIPHRESDPTLKRWVGPGVSSDPQVAAEIGSFFTFNKVREVVMTDGIVGCPHEEGVDFPVDGTCQDCTFWRENPE